MKKFVAIVLSVIMLLCVTVMSVSAAVEVEIYSPLANISAGSKVPVTVELSGLENAVEYSVTVTVSDSSMLADGKSTITFSDSVMEFGEFTEPQNLVYLDSTVSNTKNIRISDDAVSDNLTFTITDVKVYGVDESSGSNEDLEWVYIYERTDISASVGGADSVTIEVAANVTSSEPVSSSPSSSETSSETSSEASSETSSELTSSDVSDPFAVVSSDVSDTPSEEDVFNTVTDVSSNGTSHTIITSYNFQNNGGTSILVILLIIAFAFIAGLATMFIVTKVRNSKDDDEPETDEEYFGGYQQGFVVPVVKQDNSADDGYKTVVEEDVKINESKKPKFNINIEFDDSWNVKTEDEGIFEVTDDVEPEAPKNDDIEPYYYDED